MAWTRAIDLDRWADERESQGLFPLLIRKLITQTTAEPSQLNIPAQEQIGRPGFDGLVHVAQGNRFVPTGQSVWEMGVNQDPRQKAQRDFARRQSEASRDTTFIFVTPRNWRDKDEWATERAATSGWKNVIALDANDLEHWLEIARSVDSWISTLTNRLPQGLQSIDAYWDGLSAIAAHRLTPRVFIASRETEVKAVWTWLADAPDSHLLRTTTLTDGIDFLAALAADAKASTLSDTPTLASHRSTLLQDAIVVHSAEDWRQLFAVRGSLLLIPYPTLTLNATDIATAVHSGHYVLVTGPRGVVSTERALTLRGLESFELTQALVESGFSTAEAQEFARGACGSSAILKRLITRHPETSFPIWAQEALAAELAPFALVGGWRNVDPSMPSGDSQLPHLLRASPPVDVEVVAELVGCSQGDLDAVITRWSTSEEPLFLRFGDRVLVTSRQDAWYLLGHALTDSCLKRFADLAELVLEEDNPALELEPDKRWMASIYGKTHLFSSELRRSLVESLALMATYPTSQGSVQKWRYRATVQQIIEKALPKAATWQRWASLGENLRTIAEADPGLFLERVEADLDSEAPVLPKLFTESMGGFTRGQLYCDLLWSLEILAWSPMYLARVAVIFARLASLLPPTFKSGNSPLNSLCEIFLLWLWHTNANTDEKIAALKSLIRTAPGTGWTLLKELLPSGHTTVSHNTEMPRWRDWAYGWSREVIQPDIETYAVAVAELAIQEANTNPSRWAAIIDGILRVNDAITEVTLAKLGAIAAKFNSNPDSAFALWNALLALIARHERFAGSEWCFDRTILSRLSHVRDALAPKDPVLKYRWLFQLQAELHEPRIEDDYEAHYKALRQARSSALREVIAAAGVPGVLRLISLDGDAIAVGCILAEDDLLSSDALALPTLLTSDDDARKQLASAFLSCAFAGHGWGSIEAMSVEKWPLSAKTGVALALPFSRDVWTWVATLGADVEHDYWEKTRQYPRDASLDDLRFAISSLISRGRPLAAIRLLQSPLTTKLDVPSELIGEVLESSLSKSTDADSDDVSDLGYSVQQLIKTLQKDPAFDRTRLASIEWGYLPLLDRSYSKVGPDTLIDAVANNPSLFAEMIAVSFRSSNEQSIAAEMTQQDEIKARRAYEFIKNLKRLPGILDEGTLNAAAFTSWIKDLRQRVDESGHREICESMLGEVVARALKGRLDDPWIVDEVAPFLEHTGSEEFFEGMGTGFFNSRGITSRGMLDGGVQERDLATRFRERAKAVRPVSGKLAAVFDGMSERYDAAAKREDEDAARHRLGR